MLPKQMAYLSVRDVETKPLLWFEIEHYHEKENRLAYANATFESLEEQEMLREEKSLAHLGWVMALGFMVSDFSKPNFHQNKEGKTGALAIYTNADSKNARICIDEEPYAINSKRRFHASVPLKSLIMSEVCRDEKFCKHIAAITVKMLMPDVPCASEYLRWRTHSK